MPASRHQDHTLSPSAIGKRSSAAPLASTASLAQRVVTIAIRPSYRAGTIGISNGVSSKRRSEIFLAGGLDSGCGHAGDLPVGQIRLTLVDQPFQLDGLFAGMNRDGGVAVVHVDAVSGDALEDGVTLDDVKSKPLGSRKYAENDIVSLNDGSQRPCFIVGRPYELAGLGRELTQFFKLGHFLLQRNADERRQSATICLPKAEFQKIGAGKNRPVEPASSGSLRIFN